MAGYITAADLSGFYDSRRVGELLSDATDGTPIAQADRDTNARFKALSLAASAEVDSACQVGRRYTRAALEEIISDAVTYTSDAAIQKRAALLKQLVCDLTFGRLLSSRGYSGDTFARLAPRYAVAEEMLRQLWAGERIFDLDANINAGVPSTVVIGRRRLTSGQYNRLFGLWPGGPTTYGADPSGSEY